MTNFNVGPATVYPQLADYLKDAYNEGVLSMPHRGAAFVEMMQNTVSLLKEKLNIPKDYTILFTSSATECWEIIAQSLTIQKSYHLFSGAFGEKWFKYTQKIHPLAEGFLIDCQTPININTLQKTLTFAERRGGNLVMGDKELICLTQNETSNGTQILMETLRDAKKLYPNQLFAIDATSSMGGIAFEWQHADIWYGSVQKCFGLPAGLAIMVLSPRAIARTIEINEKNHYNSLLSMYENMQKFQTTHTPNVLGIYLLMRVMQHVENISVISEKTKKRATELYQLLNSFYEYNLLIKTEIVRSDTVIAIEATPIAIQNIKEKAKKANILLGNGYDIWKETTFRIANFPAISEQDVKLLENLFLEK